MMRAFAFRAMHSVDGCRGVLKMAELGNATHVVEASMVHGQLCMKHACCPLSQSIR